MIYSLILLLSLWSIPFASAGGEMEYTRPTWESQCYLMEGVYYLMSEGDRDMAEQMFRRAILSSSFDGLSAEKKQGKQVVAEAFYFLGKIHYEKVVSGEDITQHIPWARKYLREARRYGIIHDQLHPPLLDEIDRKYPEMDLPDLKSEGEKTEAIIEIDGGIYHINAVKVDQYAGVTENSYMTNRKLDLECGKRYKMKPDMQRGYRAVYKALSVLGIGLMIWFTRD